MIQSEMSKKEKSKGVAYALWFFLGGLGGHRYYAGDIGMGIAMTLTLGGLGFWALIDVFFIGKRIEKKNEELEYQVIQQVQALNRHIS
jgi:TM2 domain-containing membrane protein YozV